MEEERPRCLPLGAQEGSTSVKGPSLERPLSSHGGLHTELCWSPVLSRDSREGSKQ